MYVQGQHCCLCSAPEKQEKGTGEALLTAAVGRPPGLSGFGRAEQVPEQDAEDRKGLGAGTYLALEWARCRELTQLKTVNWTQSGEQAATMGYSSLHSWPRMRVQRRCDPWKGHI